MGCELLDFRCIFMNELIGSTVLTVVIAMIVYFIIAAKNRWGFDTTIVTLFPMMLIAGLAFTGFSVMFAFATIVVALIAASLINRFLGN